MSSVGSFRRAYRTLGSAARLAASSPSSITARSARRPSSSVLSSLASSSPSSPHPYRPGHSVTDPSVVSEIRTYRTKTEWTVPVPHPSSRGREVKCGRTRTGVKHPVKTKVLREREPFRRLRPSKSGIVSTPLTWFRSHLVLDVERQGSRSVRMTRDRGGKEISGGGERVGVTGTSRDWEEGVRSSSRRGPLRVKKKTPRTRWDWTVRDWRVRGWGWLGAVESGPS